MTPEREQRLREAAVAASFDQEGPRRPGRPPKVPGRPRRVPEGPKVRSRRDAKAGTKSRDSGTPDPSS